MGASRMDDFNHHRLHVAEDEDDDAPFKADEAEEFCSESCLNITIGLSVLLQFILLMIKLILRGEINDAKHESHDPMQAVDAVQYSVAALRNAWLINHIRKHIPEHRLHLAAYFSCRELLCEALCGPSAELLLELTLTAAIGISLEIVAFTLTFSSVNVAYVHYTAQTVNFAVLFALILVTERAWSQIRLICRWQQVVQVMLIIYDIVLHTITMSKPGMNHDFRDFRLASLASLIAVRVIAFRVFSFKAHTPTHSYTNPLHAKMNILQGAELAP